MGRSVKSRVLGLTGLYELAGHDRVDFLAVVVQYLAIEKGANYWEGMTGARDIFLTSMTGARVFWVFS